MRALCLSVFVLILSASTHAQTRPVEESEERGGQTRADEERLYDDLVAQFQNDYLRFTTLVRIVPTVPFEDDSGDEAGFDVAAAWLGIGGRLGEGVGYFVRGAFERDPTLLEAFVSYGSDDVRVLVGRQMVPFSYEFLVGAPNLDFVERSLAVRQLGPGRRTGAAVNADLGPVRLRGGVFNASYTVNIDGETVTQRERGGVLVAGRAQSTLAGEGYEVILGASAGYDTPDTSDQIESAGRVLLGADARLRLGRVLVAGEIIYNDLVLPERFSTVSGVRVGGYTTLGVDLTGSDRVLARLDVFDIGGTRFDKVVLGYNRTLTRAASVQVNAYLPTSVQGDARQMLANFQLAF